MGLLWFHAFPAASVQDVVRLLKDGLNASFRRAGSATTRNETALGIPASVYVYLGMSFERFASNCLTLEFHAFDGQFSPFHTGGLVKNTRPLDTWNDDQRREFLAQYTWDKNGLLQRLPDHPGTNVPGYLDCKQPSHAGPHALWGGEIAADIWQQNSEPECWLWEGRREGQHPVGDNLFRWSCLSHLFPQIYDLALEADETEQDWFKFLMKRYVPGGTGALVRNLRTIQEAP